MSSFEVQELGTLLAGFISADDSERKKAESAFETAKQQDINKLLCLLLIILCQDTDAVRRQQAAIAIRNVFRGMIRKDPTDSERVWASLSEETQTLFKTKILEAAQAESISMVRSAIGDVISDVGSALISEDLWPELPRIVVQMAAAPNPNLSSLGLKVLGELVPQMEKEMSEEVGNLANMIDAKLAESDSSVHIECVGVICQFVLFQIRAVWKVFQRCVPRILEIYLEHAKKDDTEVAEHILRHLIDIAETDSELFKPHIQTVLETALLLARDEKVSDDCRQLSVEFVLSIVENKQGMCLRVSGFLDVLVTTLMEMMLCIEDDWEWVDKTMNEDDDKTANYGIGECGLDRVGSLLPSDVIMPLIFRKVAEFAARGTWTAKVSAIMAISQTIEYLDEDEAEARLEEVTQFLLTMLRDPHPRVRYAACHAIGQVSLDQQPLFQQLFSSEVLTAIICAIDDPSPIVQGHALSAFVNFTEEVDAEELLTVADLVMQKFLERLSPSFTLPPESCENSPTNLNARLRVIREFSVTSVAVVAGVLENRFVKYYPTVVPLMKQIVESAVDPEDSTIRGKSLECLSVICYSVGMDICRDDIGDVMRVMITLYQQPLNDDDPVKGYLQEGMCRTIKALGLQFQPFITDLLPKLLSDIKVQPEMVDREDPDYTFVSLATEGKFKGIKTGAIEDIEKAVLVVTAIASAVKGGFAPHADAAISAIIPLLEFEFSDTVRHLALQSIAEIMSSARAGDTPVQQLTAWVTKVIELLFRNFAITDTLLADIDDMTADISGLAQCIENAGANVLSGDHVEVICQKVFKLMAGSAERRRDNEKLKLDPDNDEEDALKYEEEQQKEQIFRSTLLETTRALMKNYGKLFIERGGSMCLEFVKAYFSSNSSPEDKALSIYVSDDILEQLGPIGYPLWDEFVPNIVVSITDTHNPIRQAACFGCKFICSRPDIDQAVLVGIVQRLNSVISDPKSLQKDCRSGAENAVSALICCLEHHPECFGNNVQDQCDAILKLLPFKADELEASEVYGKIFKSLLDTSSPFYGPNSRNVPHLMKIMGAVYKGAFSTDELDTAILRVVNVIGVEAAKASVSSIKLTKGESRNIQRIVRDAPNVTTVTPV